MKLRFFKISANLIKIVIILIQRLDNYKSIEFWNIYTRPCDEINI